MCVYMGACTRAGVRDAPTKIAKHRPAPWHSHLDRCGVRIGSTRPNDGLHERHVNLLHIARHPSGGRNDSVRRGPQLGAAVLCRHVTQRVVHEDFVSRVALTGDDAPTPAVHMQVLHTVGCCPPFGHIGWQRRRTRRHRQRGVRAEPPNERLPPEEVGHKVLSYWVCSNIRAHPRGPAGQERAQCTTASAASLQDGASCRKI